MKIRTIQENNTKIAVVTSNEVLVKDAQSALDLMISVGYESGCSRIILDKSALCEEFFDLKTRLAGEILQKCVNYQVKIAIIGDFSGYPSKSLKAFIYESNRGKDIFFVSSEEEAIKRLSMD